MTTAEIAWLTLAFFIGFLVGHLSGIWRGIQGTWKYLRSQFDFTPRVFEKKEDEPKTVKEEKDEQ